MTKRVNGEGSIYHRKDGRWEASLAYTDDAGQRQRARVIRRSREAARAELDVMRRRLSDGVAVTDSTMTLEAWLTVWQATTLVAKDVKPSTRELYAKALSRWVIPYLGASRLDRLRPLDVERWLLKLEADGKSSSSRRVAYNVLRSALDTAVRDNLLRRNPVAVVQRPTGSSPEAVALTPEQVAKALTATSAHRMGPLVLLLAHTGLRIGEALGLRWEDVDLEAGSLRVTATLYRVGGKLDRSAPKSARSRRTLPLTPAVVKALKAHRKAQRAERIALGPAWTDTGLVFTTEAGTPLEATNLLRWYKTTAGVPGGFHTLRHSAATALMAAGVPLRVVADVLGHSSTRITADIYSHVSTALATDALAKLEGVYGSSS